MNEDRMKASEKVTGRSTLRPGRDNSPTLNLDGSEK
jgi:hypothetical protein